MNQNLEFSIIFFIILGTVGKLLGTVGLILDRWVKRLPLNAYEKSMNRPLDGVRPTDTRLKF